MKTCTVYEYDPQLRPGTLGVDFEDENPDHSYTLRFEREDGEYLMKELQFWFYGEPQNGAPNLVPNHRADTPRS